jgi:sterol desaturase/sphingolipid hydroxylase (fatty acid hydroxylase superfamily)
VILLIVGLAFAGFVAERVWPANELPKTRAWWPRVIFVNVIQLGVVILAGLTWDRWLARKSVFQLSSSLGDPMAALITYFISTFIYYWWHRVRHESQLFWRLCHQLHHSPRRLELLTSFYKHPVEIVLNSLLSSALAYTILGCSVTAAGFYTIVCALAELFYHWNIRTPRWLGHLIQRPESHRVHHRYRHHTQNFADLPLWDWMFGTLHNPKISPASCGFEPWREDRFEDLLGFRDVHAINDPNLLKPLQFLPTCIGCRKRWACAASHASS